MYLQAAMAVKDVLWQLPVRAGNARRNARCGDGERILVVQNAVKQRTVARDFFAWIEWHVPELFERIEFAVLPCRAPDPRRYRLVVFSGGDILPDYAPWIFRQAMRLSKRCAELGIDVMNPASSWFTKSQSARIMAGLGIRTPRIEPICDVDVFLSRAESLQTPLLIRDDQSHGRPSYLVESEAELRRVPWHRLRRPMAAEFIDTRNPIDGLYRKYRYVAVDGVGLSHHLVFSHHWEVRGSQVKSDATRDEECDFIYRPDRNHAQLQAVRRALGLGLVAFDYAYDLAGRLVVWEANAFPDINYRMNHWSRHARRAQDRTFAALARDLMRRACWPVPALLDDLLIGMPDDDRQASSPRTLTHLLAV